MKNILLISISPDPPGGHRIVQVKDTDAAVGFCARWAERGETAWIDLAEDSKRLIAMWDRLNRIPSQNFPCHIDDVIEGWYS